MDIAALIDVIQCAVGLFIVLCITVAMWISFRKMRKSRKSIKNRHVLITGIGLNRIGLSIATYCVKFGANVTILDESLNSLEMAMEQLQTHRINEMQTIKCRAIKLYVSYHAVETYLTDLEEECGPIFMLINCVGSDGIVHGTIDEMSIEDEKSIMAINYYATYYPTRYVLSKMKKLGDGIITVAACPFDGNSLGLCAPAKYAVRGMAEKIQSEIADTNISVTLASRLHMDLATRVDKIDSTKIDGLVDVDAIAKKILDDSLAGIFISTNGENWFKKFVFGAQSIRNGFLPTALRIFLYSSLRWIVFGLYHYCRRRSENNVELNVCADEKVVEVKNEEKAKLNDEKEEEAIKREKTPSDFLKPLIGATSLDKLFTLTPIETPEMILGKNQHAAHMRKNKSMDSNILPVEIGKSSGWHSPTFAWQSTNPLYVFGLSSDQPDLNNRSSSPISSTTNETFLSQMSAELIPKMENQTDSLANSSYGGGGDKENDINNSVENNNNKSLASAIPIPIPVPKATATELKVPFSFNAPDETKVSTQFRFDLKMPSSGTNIFAAESKKSESVAVRKPLHARRSKKEKSGH